MHRELFDHLREEHKEIKQLLVSILQTTVDDQHIRTNLLRNLEASLRPHLKAEELYFYPVLRGRAEMHEHAVEALEEHHAAAVILDELLVINTEADNWIEKANVLCEVVDHHILKEENGIFLQAQHVLDKETVEEIHRNVMEKEHDMRQHIAV